MLRPTVLMMFWLLTLGGKAQVVDLAVHGFRSDVTVPIGDLTRRSLEYAFLPIGESSGMDFAASVTNAGPDTAHNVVVRMWARLDEVDLGTFDSDTLPYLTPGATDTLPISADLQVNQDFPPLSLLFTVNSESSDTLLSNNHDSTGISIQLNRFMRAEREWTDTVGTGPDGTIMFVRYEVTQAEVEACGLMCVVPFDPDFMGYWLIGRIYDEDFNLLRENDYSITEYDMSDPGETHWIFISLLDYTILESGHDYYAAIQTFNYGGQPMSFACAGPCADSSAFRYDETSGSWSALDRTPIIGLLTGPNCFWGFDELGTPSLRLGPCIPNPATSLTRLKYSMRDENAVRLEVRDIMGALVNAVRIGRQPPGEHEYHLDVSALPDGVYTYSIIADHSQVTRLVTVMH